MSLKLVFASLAAFVAVTARAETLVTCDVSHETSATVVVDKYVPALPPEQQHFTDLATVDGYRYVIAETFDGSGKIGIGRAQIIDAALSFDVWTFARPPLDLLVAPGVFIYCK